MLRAIQEIKPRLVIAENVFGITNIDGGLVFEQVCLDLEAEGYEVQPFIIPAAAKNAPHRRDRCWFIATNSNCNGLNQCNSDNEINTSEGGQYALNDIDKVTMHTDNQGLEGIKNKGKIERKRTGKQQFTSRPICPNWQNFPTQSPVCGGDDGIPTNLDGITFSKWRAESIKGYGNAIVPQIAYQLFQIIATLCK